MRYDMHFSVFFYKICVVTHNLHIYMMQIPLIFNHL